VAELLRVNVHAKQNTSRSQQLKDPCTSCKQDKSFKKYQGSKFSISMINTRKLPRHKVHFIYCYKKILGIFCIIRSETIDALILESLCQIIFVSVSPRTKPSTRPSSWT